MTCKHLDYEKENYPSCTLEQLSYRGTTQLVWDRRKPDGDFQLCQFCKLRGRLNNAEACLCKQDAMCSEYEEKADGGEPKNV